MRRASAWGASSVKNTVDACFHRVAKWRFCLSKVPLLQCKTAVFALQNGHFRNAKTATFERCKSFFVEHGDTEAQRFFQRKADFFFNFAPLRLCV